MPGGVGILRPVGASGMPAHWAHTGMYLLVPGRQAFLIVVGVRSDVACLGRVFARCRRHDRVSVSTAVRCEPPPAVILVPQQRPGTHPRPGWVHARHPIPAVLPNPNENHDQNDDDERKEAHGRSLRSGCGCGRWRVIRYRTGSSSSTPPRRLMVHISNAVSSPSCPLVGLRRA